MVQDEPMPRFPDMVWDHSQINLDTFYYYRILKLEWTSN